MKRMNKKTPPTLVCTHFCPVSNTLDLNCVYCPVNCSLVYRVMFSVLHSMHYGYLAYYRHHANVASQLSDFRYIAFPYQSCSIYNIPYDVHSVHLLTRTHAHIYVRHAFRSCSCLHVNGKWRFYMIFISNSTA